MRRVDAHQFSEKNKMLFREDRWFIFLDLGDFSKTGYYPRLAHKCKPEDRVAHGHDDRWIKMYSCSLLIVDNQCQDCAAPLPEVLSGFFNLAEWGFE